MLEIEYNSGDPTKLFISNIIRVGLNQYDVIIQTHGGDIHFNKEDFEDIVDEWEKQSGC